MSLAITADGAKFYKNGVEITDGVKINKNKVAIGSACENPVCIIFPFYVKAIEDHAFENIDSLQAIYIPEGLKEIGFNAFAGCSNLRHVIVHDSIETIEYSQPERKWEISTGKQYDYLTEMLKRGVYVVHLYKSGEDFSWD